jgi:O-antigen/teichoic acid export membrane protein
LKGDEYHPGDAGEGGFVRNSIFLVSIELIAKLMGLVLFMLMARVLGAEAVGLYEGSLALVGFLALFVDFGFDRLVQRDLGRDTTLLYSHYREINIIKLAFSIVCILIIWLFLILRGDPDSTVVMIIAFFGFTLSFSTFNNALFRGIGKPEYEVGVRLIFSILNLCLGAIALYSGWGLLGVVGCQLFSIGFSLLIAFIIIERIAPKVGYSWKWGALKQHVKAAAPFAAMFIVLYFGNQVNVLLLALLTNKADVGYFAAARRLFDAFTLIPAAIVGAFLPTMSKLYCTSISRFTRTLRFTMKYMYVISIPIVVGTAVVAHPLIVFLFKEPFEPAAGAMQLLMLSLVFSFWNHAATALLIARNREGILIWLFAGAAVVHMAGNLILIPLLSYNGAALAVLVTQVVQLIIFHYATLRRYTSSLKLLLLIIGPTLCAGVMAAVVYFTLPFGLWVAIPAGIVVYPAALLVTKTAHQRDLQSLKRMLRVRAEIKSADAEQ